MSKKLWIVPLAALGGIVLWRKLKAVEWQRAAINEKLFGGPNAKVYDALFSPLMGGLFGGIASEVATMCPVGNVLEVGSGPGVLATRIAQAAPGVSVIALDLSPEMLELARTRAAGLGLGDRLRFELADVAAMPFPDGHFDMIVSTFSAHHWADPARGLSELHRVLKLGGEARIYDMDDWILHILQHGASDLQLVAAATPFKWGTTQPVWKIGPVPIVRLLTLQRR
jgi:ubiquinone/menaquinone biosynthesis C-methylase UbiE